ncbi:hypothetical protein Tco_0200672 [Tanacetum coccineum]
MRTRPMVRFAYDYDCDIRNTLEGKCHWLMSLSIERHGTALRVSVFSHRQLVLDAFLSKILNAQTEASETREQTRLRMFGGSTSPDYVPGPGGAEQGTTLTYLHYLLFRTLFTGVIYQWTGMMRSHLTIDDVDTEEESISSATLKLFAYSADQDPSTLLIASRLGVHPTLGAGTSDEYHARWSTVEIAEICLPLRNEAASLLTSPVPGYDGRDAAPGRQTSREMMRSYILSWMMHDMTELYLDAREVHSEGISLRTTVMAQQSEITELQAADRRRQSVISDLLKADYRRQKTASENGTKRKAHEVKPRGTEGVVDLTQWFERMETVFRISNCTVENQVKNCGPKVKGTDVVAYNQRFQELALLCDRMFPEETDKIERRNNTFAERQTENKRKFEDTPQNNQNQQQNKRQNLRQGLCCRER